MLRRLTPALAGAALAFAVLLSAASAASSYKIVRLIEGADRPDIPCNPGCTPFSIFFTPVISGNRVAFVSRNGPPDGVWSININSKVLTKLAGFETPVPGGTGNFSAFPIDADKRLTIGGDTVAFFGWDQANVLGLYTVPIGGGTVTKIAAVGSASPDGTNFSGLRWASTNGSKIVFNGSTADHFTGIYQTNVDGTKRKTVIDDDTTLDARTPSGPAEDYFNIYSSPVIGNSYVEFSASGLFDPVSGANAIFRARNGFQDIADNLTLLEKGDGTHVRIQALSADVQSGAVAFRADEPNTGFAGLFKVKDIDNAQAFATTEDTVPGTTKKFSSFGGFGYDSSGIAFVATRPISGGTDTSIYFAATPGDPIVRVASGQKFFVPTLGDRSISEGNIVFMDGSNFADTIYVAVPRD